MSLKVNTPNDKGNINITIENNLFSKNKSGQNKKRSPVGKRKEHGGGSSGLVESVRNPYEPEPSFLSEIKTAMNERNFYGMKFNPRPSIMPPMYNNWYDTHSRSLQIEEMNDENEDKLPPAPREVIDFEEYDEDQEQPVDNATELDENIEEYTVPSPSPATLPQLRTPVKTRGAKVQAKFIGETVYFDKDGNYNFRVDTKKDRTLRDNLIKKREQILRGEKNAYSKTLYKLGLPY